jgi:hypothetical protein
MTLEIGMRATSSTIDLMDMAYTNGAMVTPMRELSPVD